MENAYPDQPILIVDDDEDVNKAVARTLRANGFSNLLALTDSRKVLPLLGEQEISVALLDISMPNIRGDELLQQVVENYPFIPVIMATATDSIEMVVNCMKKGAIDYISKPLSTARLIASISGALQLRDLRLENCAQRRKTTVRLPKHPEFFRDTITDDPQMLALFRYIEAISSSSQPVLITGETGVGKELAAGAIHRASCRKGQFVAVNVAGLDDEVFADTLFGHIKGAFTGAGGNRDGQIRKASAGTLFLDEIGDLSLKSQVKLLRLLQEKEYLPLGADTAQSTDARIVVATNSNLESLVEQGLFRKDLYFRLYAHHVALPPLKKRLGDLPLLVNAFVLEACQEYNKKINSVSPELFPLLRNYSFPGNIRELKAMVFDAVSRQRGSILGLESFMASTGHHAKKKKGGFEKDTGDKVVFGSQLPSIKEVRIKLVREALIRSQGNISSAARLIGLSRQSLSQFMQSHKITSPVLPR